MKTAIIYDIDGTLSDPSSRLDFISGVKKDWQAFYQACDKDNPYLAIIDQLKADHKKGHKIVLMTGRIESVRQKTIQWLNQYSIPYDILLMRQEGDYKKDYEMKVTWINNLPDFNFLRAYDDMQHNVDAFKDLGVNAILVEDGIVL